ncbi:MAG: hypothetical protein J5976_00815 [Bacteroidales bacterium]|nr:hypothetical protein [Bacteroidales bacterium]
MLSEVTLNPQLRRLLPLWVVGQVPKVGAKIVIFFGFAIICFIGAVIFSLGRRGQSTGMAGVAMHEGEVPAAGVVDVDERCGRGWEAKTAVLETA